MGGGRRVAHQQTAADLLHTNLLCLKTFQRLFQFVLHEIRVYAVGNIVLDSATKGGR
jgi:hypothetical protein